MSSPQVEAFFDKATNTVSYVVSDRGTGRCAVIDSVLDYDHASGRIGTVSADAVIDHVRVNGFQVDWIIDTHVHADHLTAAHYICRHLGGRIGIGGEVPSVQRVFGDIFNEDGSFARDGSQFDHLFRDNETYNIGSLKAYAMHTPGHTSACMSHVIGDAVFVGDTLFMPDFGTARCDFPGGDPGVLYDSIQRLFNLPDEMRMFLCHDYKAPGRDFFAWETTVRDQRVHNVHIRQGISRDEFVRLRTERDATLSMPKLILPSVQVNMRAGDMPEPECNGRSYIKIPINTL